MGAQQSQQPKGDAEAPAEPVDDGREIDDPRTPYPGVPQDLDDEDEAPEEDPEEHPKGNPEDPENPTNDDAEFPQFEDPSAEEPNEWDDPAPPVPVSAKSRQPSAASRQATARQPSARQPSAREPSAREPSARPPTARQPTAKSVAPSELMAPAAAVQSATPGPRTPTPAPPDHKEGDEEEDDEDDEWTDSDDEDNIYNQAGAKGAYTIYGLPKMYKNSDRIGPARPGDADYDDMNPEHVEAARQAAEEERIAAEHAATEELARQEEEAAKTQPNSAWSRQMTELQEHKEEEDDEDDKPHLDEVKEEPEKTDGEYWIEEAPEEEEKPIVHQGPDPRGSKMFGLFYMPGFLHRMGQKKELSDEEKKEQEGIYLPDVLDEFEDCFFTFLGMVHVLIGLAMVFVCLVGLAVGQYLRFAFCGVWAGAVFIATGVMGMVASQTETRAHIHVFLYCCMASVVAGILCGVIGGISGNMDGIYYHPYQLDSDAHFMKRLVVDILYIFLGTAEAIVAIGSSYSTITLLNDEFIYRCYGAKKLRDAQEKRKADRIAIYVQKHEEKQERKKERQAEKLAELAALKRDREGAMV